MENMHISNINKKDLLLSPRKYLWLQIPDEYSNVNFSLLLDFIDEYSAYGKEHKYGNAFYRIRKKANSLWGVGRYSPMKLKTSKHEIRSIINSTVSKIDGNSYLKIPYKISYIFKAIILIIEEIKKENNINIPSNLEHTIKVTYGIAFYEKYLDTYDTYYNEIQDEYISDIGFWLRVELNNDFHSYNSVFNTIVK